MCEGPMATENLVHCGNDSPSASLAHGKQGRRVSGHDMADPGRGHLPAFQTLGTSCILNLSFSTSFFLSFLQYAQISSILTSSHLRR